ANLLLGGALGAMIYAMYPIVVAHANDHAAPGDYISTSGGLLMVFVIGSIIGPFIGGLAITLSGPLALFWMMMAAHLLILLFSIWRIQRREKLDMADKGIFQNIPPARHSTPETRVLAGGQDQK
ncbi:MAG: MFS transporter, partial [Sphingomonadales bacterium CG_4_10_14_3_um_filter_58_15]